MPNPKTVGSVAINLPADLLRDVERVRRKTGESRSALIRRSIELLLGRVEEARMVREYVAGYRTHPEGRVEVGGAMALAKSCLEGRAGSLSRRRSPRSIGR